MRPPAGPRWTGVIARRKLLSSDSRVGGGVLEGLDHRRTVDDGAQLREDLRVRARLVGVGALLVVPEADGARALRAEQRHFLLETGLLAQHRQDLVLEHSGKLL